MNQELTSSERVAILGASNKPDRYSYKAMHLLQEHGHEVVPVHPVIPEIDGIEVTPSLEDIEEPVDTLTLYVNPQVSSQLTDAIINLKPGRVIFNPGTESTDLQVQLDQAGIVYEEACTLVLLHSGQF